VEIPPVIPMAGIQVRIKSTSGFRAGSFSTSVTFCPIRLVHAHKSVTEPAWDADLLTSRRALTPYKRPGQNCGNRFAPSRRCRKSCPEFCSSYSQQQRKAGTTCY
jgi:hypothetical protein